MARALSAFRRASGKAPRHAPKGTIEGGQFIGRSSILHAIMRLLGERDGRQVGAPDHRQGSVVQGRPGAARRVARGMAARRRTRTDSGNQAAVARLIKGQAATGRQRERRRGPSQQAVRRAVGTVEQIAALERMGTRAEAIDYVNGIRGQALTDLARHYHAHTRRTAADRRAAIVEAAVGFRLDAAAINPGGSGGGRRGLPPMTLPPAEPTYVVRPAGFGHAVIRVDPDGTEKRITTYSSKANALRRAARLSKPTAPAPVSPSLRSTSVVAPDDGLDALEDHSLRSLAQEYGVPMARINFAPREDLLSELRDRGAVAPSLRVSRANARIGGQITSTPPDRVSGRRPSAGLRISLALQTWSHGEGSDRPLEGFTREQLRGEARLRGLLVRRGTTADQLAEMLMEQTRREHRGRRESVSSLPRVGDLLDNPTLARAREIFEGDFGGMTTHVDHAGTPWYGGSGISVSGYVTDAAGQQVGTFHRRYTRDGSGKLVAHHEFLQISGQVQGSGFSNAFNGHLIQWYRQSGVKEVRVHADIDVGGYAWARMGYDFAHSGSASDIVRRLRDYVDDLNGRPPAALQRAFPGAANPQAQLVAARELLSRAATHRFGQVGFPTPYEISQLGRWQGAGRLDMWVGKRVLLGSDWHGVLRL